MPSYDITFCSNKECKNMECERNQNRIDLTLIPRISIANFEQTCTKKK